MGGVSNAALNMCVVMGWAARHLLNARRQGSKKPFLTCKSPVSKQTPFALTLIVSET